MDSILGYVSQLLGKATNCVGVAALSALEEVQIQRMNFVRLGGSTVLVLIVLEGGLVHHANIQLPCEISQDILDDLARKISAVACGHPWGQVRTPSSPTFSTAWSGSGIPAGRPWSRWTPF